MTNNIILQKVYSLSVSEPCKITYHENEQVVLFTNDP
jgi:hypothetical protein